MEKMKEVLTGDPDALKMLADLELITIMQRTGQQRKHYIRGEMC